MDNLRRKILHTSLFNLRYLLQSFYYPVINELIKYAIINYIKSYYMI